MKKQTEKRSRTEGNRKGLCIMGTVGRTKAPANEHEPYPSFQLFYFLNYLITILVIPYKFLL